MAQEEHSQSIGYTDKCRWPFRAHHNHERVFAPWGVMGTQYQVRDLAEYGELKSMASLYVFGILILCHLGGLLKYRFSDYLEVGVLLVTTVCYLLSLRRATRRLTVVEPRPGLRTGFRHWGRAANLWGLWATNLAFVGLAGLLLSSPAAAPGHLAAKWFVGSLFATGALVTSYMIACHNASSRLTRH